MAILGKAMLKYEGMGAGHGYMFGTFNAVLEVSDQLLVEESALLGTIRKANTLPSKILTQLKTHKSFGRVEDVKLVEVLLSA